MSPTRAPDRILRHRQQPQRDPAAQAQLVQGRAPGEAMQAIVESLEQREATIVTDPDQPLPLPDPLLAIGGLFLLEQAYPRRHWMLPE